MSHARSLPPPLSFTFLFFPGDGRPGENGEASSLPPPPRSMCTRVPSSPNAPDGGSLQTARPALRTLTRMTAIAPFPCYFRYTAKLSPAFFKLPPPPQKKKSRTHRKKYVCPRRRMLPNPASNNCLLLCIPKLLNSVRFTFARSCGGSDRWEFLCLYVYATEKEYIPELRKKKPEPVYCFSLLI